MGCGVEVGCQVGEKGDEVWGWLAGGGKVG